MNRQQKRAYWLLIIVGTVLTVFFGLWWFNIAHVPSNFNGILHIFDWLLFIFLTYVIWQPITSEMLLWYIMRRIEQPKQLQPNKELRVAFITTFVPSSEPLEMLHSTLPAMVAADFKHDTWLLDEGNSSEAQAICKQYGVRYFSRYGISKFNTPSGVFAAKTKGGNHNAWYATYANDYDVVAQIDTDFKPRRDFLTKTLGYFNDPRVGFVGTPQIYGNTKKSFIARGAAEQTYGFYGPILRGLHGKDMTLLIGANHIVRVAALRDVGFYSAHLTEDLLTGMKLHAKRWRSVYVPELLAIGEGPTTWSAYFNQQMRWAHGCIDILFSHSPRLLKRMRVRHALRYFLLQQHYFTGTAMAVGIFLITLFAICGLNASTMDIGSLIALYLPLIVWQTIIVLWSQRFYVDPKKESGLLMYGRLISIAAWPIYFMAFVSVLRGKRLSFKVTPKGNKQNQNNLSLKVFRIHIVLGTITLADTVITMVNGRSSLIIIFWSCVNTALMYGFAFGPYIVRAIHKIRFPLRFWQRARQP